MFAQTRYMLYLLTKKEPNKYWNHDCIVNEYIIM